MLTNSHIALMGLIGKLTLWYVTATFHDPINFVLDKSPLLHSFLLNILSHHIAEVKWLANSDSR